MQFEKYVNRLSYVETLIEKQGTGTPKELAGRLGISERMVYHYVDMIKASRAIKFCRKRKSYVFITAIILQWLVITL